MQIIPRDFKISLIDVSSKKKKKRNVKKFYFDSTVILI